MRKVLSIILSAALSLSVFFAVPVLPNGELPTDPNPITTENGEDEGGNEGNGDETQNPEGDGSEIKPQDIDFPEGGTGF